VIGDDEASRQRKPQSARKLTENGKKVLRVSFQLSRTPTWSQVRDKHLPSLALGIPPGSERAKKVCTETGLTAAVLGERYGVHDASTPMAVCDAMIAELLGMPRGPLTLERIRAHVLLRRIDRSSKGMPSPDEKGYASKLAAWIACSAVGASGTQRKMSRALGRRWVSGETQPPAKGAPDIVVVQPPQPLPTGAPPPQPPNLLDVVRDIIPRVGAEGRFGEKVYVSAIWHTIERDRKAGDLSLDHFKRWLLRANRDGQIVLARADLIGAMDAKQVNESEINDRGATFHFVLDQRNGAAISHRESHAG
jgi:hypothetical protein